MTTLDRALFAALLLLAGCTEPACDPDARAGDTCSGRWICAVASVGDTLLQTSCADGVVHERTWTEPVFGEPITSCDPSAAPGAACSGGWACPAETLPSSTGTQHTQISCVEDRVVRDTWIEPIETPDGGPIDVVNGPCRIVEDEEVFRGATTNACSRPSLSIDGVGVRIGFSDVASGVIATRRDGAWTLDTSSLGTNVFRVDLAGGAALVSRSGTNALELWGMGEGPHHLDTLEGIQTPAQARALGVYGSRLDVLSVHTHIDENNFYDWWVHHSSGQTGAMNEDDLVGGSVRAYDVEVASGRTSLVYENRTATERSVYLSQGVDDLEVIPLPAEVEPYPYDGVAPMFATYADGRAYVLVRRSRGQWGPVGQPFEQLVAVRAPDGSWELTTLVQDDPDPCASLPATEGSHCVIDRTSYGPEAAIVAGPSGPIVLMAETHQVGEKTWSCDNVIGCVPCTWTGEVVATRRLVVATEIGGELQPIAGGELSEWVRWMALASGSDIHLAINEYDETCAVRYVQLACE